MPTYELALVFRKLAKPELTSALRRTADAIFDQGGFIRRMDNLGVKPTPYKISDHGIRHKEAHYFIFEFESNMKVLEEIRENYRRDVDILRTRIFYTGLTKLKDPVEPECTIEEDLKPPPYRKVVKEMIAIGEKKNKKKPFDYGPGFDYYPFKK